METLGALTRLAQQLPTRRSLEDVLQCVADGTADILGVRRVSVRLLDPSRTRLLGVARAGQPLHDHEVEFAPGEGLLGWIVEHGQPICLAEPERDPRFAPRPGMETMGSFVGVPIRAGTQVTGVISAVDTGRAFEQRHADLLTLVAAMCAPHVEIARLARMAMVDPLTGSLNRRGLDQRLPAVEPHADGDTREPVVVAMVDIDHFKLVNDHHGHAVGDLVLRHVTDQMAAVLRTGDEVVRYGGEEFLVLLPGVDHELGGRIAERIRAAVAATPAQVPSGELAVTVSIGVAERRPGEDRDSLIARADAALYRAKAGGRDRVEIA